MMDWLITFVVHSTLWCGLAWLWMRLRRTASPGMKEAIWYTALAACLVTPTVQTFATPELAFWRLPVSSLESPEEGEHSQTSERGHEEFASSRSSSAEVHESQGGLMAAQWTGPASRIWFAIAAGLLIFYLGRIDALHRRLRRRESVRNSRASRTLENLSRKAGLPKAPRLTESDELGSPIALGIGDRREICVPSRALHELDDDELSAMLGHEVAHHLRRDTIRLMILNILQAVFFFQPLLRLAARDIHFAAEEQCDDWAAGQLEDRLAMASCLTEVAAWIVRRDRNLPIPCMARRRSQLEIRVHRLMDERHAFKTPIKIWRSLGCVGLLALAPWLAPAVSPPNEASHAESEHSRPERRRDGEHERRRHEEGPRVERQGRREHEGEHRDH